MLPKKEETHRNVNALALSGLNGKTVTGLSIWRAGIVEVIEINFTGGPLFIKFRQGQCDMGGDANWGTGTLT